MFNNPQELNHSQLPEIKQEKLQENTEDIYVMPDKFIPKSKKKKSNKVVLVILIILAVACLAGLAVFLFNKEVERLKREKQAPVVNQNIEEGQPQEEVTITPPGEELPPPIIPTTTEELLATTTPTTTEELISVLDTDNDGLTEEEEKLYKTDPLIPDSDGDGYLDGEEVTSLYSPISLGGKLDTSGLVNLYTNPVFKYNLFYPANWIAQALDETNTTIIFTSATGEFVEVLVLENPEQLSILKWYEEQISPEENSILEEIKNITVAGQEAIEIPNLEGQKIIYFAYQNKVYGLIYNYGNKVELNFKTTFAMMKNSFKLGQ